MSRYLDPRDKKTVTIFADGAGAALVEATGAPGILASELFADGRFCDGMGIFAGGTRTPITAEVLAAGDRNRLRFVQKYPASVNEEGWPRIVRAVLARAGATPDDVDLWLWTQVNRSTIVTVMETLGQPMARAHTVMHKWGYTGSACLPMALHDAVEAGRLRDGALVVLTGSGAGLAMGTVALRWRASGAGG
jgi:3-oxoacyl-[acyl-carrier-protein] synthase-3